MKKNNNKNMKEKEMKIDRKMIFNSVWKFVWNEKKEFRKAIILMMVLLFISVIAADVLAPYIFGMIIDTFDSLESGSSMEVLRKMFGVLILGFVGCKLLASTTWIAMRSLVVSIESKTMQKIENSIREAMFKHSISFYNSEFSGSLTNKENKFTHAYMRLFDEFAFNLWPNLWRYTGVTIVLFTMSVLFGWIFLIYAFAYMIFIYVFSTYKLPYDIISTEKSSLITGNIADIYTNVLTIFLFGKEESEIKRFKTLNKERFVARVNSWRLSNIRDNILTLCNDILISLTILLAIWKWNVGDLSNGQVVVIFAYSNQIRGYLRMLGNVVKEIFRNYSDMEEMMCLMHEATQADPSKEVKHDLIEGGSIAFDNVNFTYPENSKKLFKGLSLSIPFGQKVALVGASGSGKTTIANLLPRIYEVDSGSISIDDVDTSKLDKQYVRSKISFIPQEPSLFHRTIREIVSYGQLDASDDEIFDALRKAQAIDFIKDLDEGMHTKVGERGVKLSGGQKQRVAIARALLEKTPILILDEATSALDTKTEKEIQKALLSLLEDKDRTMLVIAHRLSTVMHLDRVIVMEDGEIVEDGSPLELLNRKNHFYKLWKEQINLETIKHQLNLLPEHEFHALTKDRVIV